MCDSLPDAWEILNFGDLSQSGDGYYDGDSANNLVEFIAGTDPNNVDFTVHLGYQYFNSTQAAGQFVVMGGVPAWSTVLVNTTNLASAVWTLYNGTAALPLGSTDGVYQVLFGLKGRAPDSMASWWGTAVVLDRVATDTLQEKLGPGRTHTNTFELDHLFEMLDDGKYTIWATRRVPSRLAAGKQVPITSEPLYITIVNK